MKLVFRLLSRRMTFAIKLAVYFIIHNKLNICKTCPKWVSKQLTDNHEETRLRLCRELEECYLTEGNELLERIVTCNGIWIHHYKENSKARGSNQIL